jgi:hypothetical protein
MANTDFYTNAFADNLRLAKSKILLSPADATFNLIRIPHYAFVKNVWLQVITACDVMNSNLTVGWSGNTETANTAGFISFDVAYPIRTGLKRAQNDTKTTFEGKYFSLGSGAITLTYAVGNATTVGTFRVFAEYIVIY